MAEILNLNRARKAKAAADRKAQAAENRIRHGRPKAETAKSRAEQDLAARRLEGHKRDDAPGD